MHRQSLHRHPIQRQRAHLRRTLVRLTRPLHLGALMIVPALASCSSSTGPAGTPNVLGPGRWGGPSAALVITAEDARVRFDFCADGTIEVPIALTSDGRFDVPGRYVRNIGPGIAAKSARYIGVWRPTSITLAVILSDPLGPDGSTLVGPFDLKAGDAGPPLHPCPV